MSKGRFSKKYTLTEARKLLGDLGLTISHSYDNDFRVNFRATDRMYRGEDSAYYTNDLDDAVGTGVAMSKYVKSTKKD